MNRVKALKGVPLSAEALKRQAGLELSANPQQVVPGVWTSGEIEDRSEAEGRSPHHLVRSGAPNERTSWPGDNGSQAL